MPTTQYSPAFQVKENKEKERLERRLLDELYKIFMDSDSFYYSMTYDLTNTVQRQGDTEKSNLPQWKQVSGYYYTQSTKVAFTKSDRWSRLAWGSPV